MPPVQLCRLCRLRFQAPRLPVSSIPALHQFDPLLRRCAVFPSLATDRIGAGDAFTAGFLYATLTGRQERALDYGLAMAALKHSLPGDTLVTTPEEVDRVVSRDSQGIRR